MDGVSDSTVAGLQYMPIDDRTIDAASLGLNPTGTMKTETTS